MSAIMVSMAPRLVGVTVVWLGAVLAVALGG